MLTEGGALSAHFSVSRPRTAGNVQAWRAHGHDLCTLRSLHTPSLMLRGGCEVLEDDSVLLLVSPVLNSLEALRAHGLAFDDFAPHDAVGEMLLLTRSMQTSAADTERLAERVRRRSQQLDTILELGQSGMLLVAPDGRVLHANGALLRMVGLARDQLPGLTARDLDARVQGLLEAGQGLGPCFGDASGLAGPQVLRLARPEPRVIELSARRSADGALAYYLRDMTVEFEVDRMKSEFLTTAAHELRTPMVSVFGFTELLLNRPIDDARRLDVLRTIHRQCSRLITMVNDLLDLARIESRQAQALSRERVCLAEVVREAVQGQHLGEGCHRIELHAQGRGELAWLDPAKTAQAIGNVLSNAVKYSPQGGLIEVALLPGQVQTAQGPRPAVGVRVSDPGVGMTAEQLARVCERFYRADPSGAIPGTGLGMSLVKEIVELQGGRVDLWSAPGEGTRVTLWFPVQGHAGEGEPAAWPPQASASPSAASDPLPA